MPFFVQQYVGALWQCSDKDKELAFIEILIEFNSYDVEAM